MNTFKYMVVFSLFWLVSVPGMAAEVPAKSVADIYKAKTELAGKQVSVTGKVVKVNNAIMNRNFLHIQDGTGGKGTNDLTVTSDQTAKVGDKVTVTGTVVLDTDFGYGYSYPLLIEKAVIDVK